MLDHKTQMANERFEKLNIIFLLDVFLLEISTF